MFKLIQWMIERFIDLVDPKSLTDRKKEARVERWGQELFKVYYSGVQLVNCGNQIVWTVESSIAGLADRQTRYPGQDHEWETDLENLLKTQAQNIDTVSLGIVYCYQAGLLLGGRSYEELRTLIVDKGIALNWLLGRLRESKLAYFEGNDPSEQTPSSNPSLFRHQRAAGELERLDGTYVNAATIRSGDVANLQLFLDMEQPRERLSIIGEKLETLRTILLSTFELSDVLPVIDRRGRR